jgi:hypothetical protein
MLNVSHQNGQINIAVMRPRCALRNPGGPNREKRENDYK